MQRLIQTVDLPANLIRPRPGHRHVFAYDELMIEARIRQLVPDPSLVTTARYPGKRIIANSDGVLTIVPRPDFVVWGVVYEISEIGVVGLDISMGSPGVCDRYGSFARGPNDEPISSDYYASRNNRTQDRADMGYLSMIVDEGQRRGFPTSYLNEIAEWAGDPVLRRSARAS